MTWTVHTKGEDVRVVPDATAKWALVFGALWLLRHKLWWEALAFGLLTGLANQLSAAAFDGEPNPAALLTFGIVLLPRLWLLLEGNEIRRAKLARQGFVEVGVVEASDAEAAKLKAAFAAPRPEPAYAEPAVSRSA